MPEVVDRGGPSALWLVGALSTLFLGFEITMRARNYFKHSCIFFRNANCNQNAIAMHLYATDRLLPIFLTDRSFSRLRVITTLAPFYGRDTFQLIDCISHK